jgi:hypothetical protein
MRLRLAFLVAAFAVIVPAAASAAVHIRGVDTTTAGRVRVTVVTDQPTTTAPTLRENGKPVSLAEAPSTSAAPRAWCSRSTARSRWAGRR